MATIGLRALRQQASELVRRAGAGETTVVTVIGREVAQLAPIHSNPWRRWADVADVFDAASKSEWTADRDRVDHAPLDPFRE